MYPIMSICAKALLHSFHPVTGHSTCVRQLGTPFLQLQRHSPKDRYCTYLPYPTLPYLPYLPLHRVNRSCNPSTTHSLPFYAIVAAPPRGFCLFSFKHRRRLKHLAGILLRNTDSCYLLLQPTPLCPAPVDPSFPEYSTAAPHLSGSIDLVDLIIHASPRTACCHQCAYH